MGLTNFPYGINAGSAGKDGGTPFQIQGTALTASAAELNYLAGASGFTLSGASAGQILVAGTVIVSSTGSTAFVPSGLTTATYVVTDVYGPLLPTAGTVGGFVAVNGSIAGGTVTIRAYDQMGTASSTAGTASYLAIGT